MSDLFGLFTEFCNRNYCFQMYLRVVVTYRIFNVLANLQTIASKIVDSTSVRSIFGRHHFVKGEKGM